MRTMGTQSVINWSRLFYKIMGNNVLRLQSAIVLGDNFTWHGCIGVMFSNTNTQTLQVIVNTLVFDMWAFQIQQ